MKVNQHSSPFQRIAILCLLQLAKNPKLHEIIQTKAVSFIVQARNKFAEVSHIHRVASMAVEVLVSPTAVTNVTVPKVVTKEADSLQMEYKDLQQKMTEKDQLLQQLHTAINQLEADVAKLKEGVDLEALSEVVQKISNKKEIAKLKQQKAALNKELKKTQVETSEVTASIDAVHSQMKEDEKKKVKEHKKSLSNPGDPLKKQEKKDASAVEKKEVIPFSGDRKKTVSAKHGSTKRTNTKDRGNSSPTKTSTKRNGSQKSGKAPKQPKNKIADNQPQNAVHTSETSLEVLPEDKEADHQTSPQDQTSMPAIAHRNSLRNINRRPSCFIQAPVSNEEILQLSKQIEEMQKRILQKDQELEESNAEKSIVDAQVNKLNTDLKGTHILIQTLQKESLSQTHNREKLVTGNSFFTRHQKKLKSIKDEITALQTENEDLRKEIAALGGDVVSSVAAPTGSNAGSTDKLEKAASKKKKKALISFGYQCCIDTMFIV